jgi:hypothetical protein
MAKKGLGSDTQDGEAQLGGRESKKLDSSGTNAMKGDESQVKYTIIAIPGQPQVQTEPTCLLIE